MTGKTWYALLMPVALAVAPAWAGPAQAETKPKVPTDPLDQLLLDYRKRIEAAVAPDLKQYEGLQKGAPRGVVLWKQTQHRYLPLPDPDPAPGELQVSLPLSALPPAWIEPLNLTGAKLFERGMAEGRTGKPSKPWTKYQPHLEDRDFAPRPIPSLSEVFPEYQGKTDYRVTAIPFAPLAAARKKLEAVLAKVPGSARGEIVLKDDDPRGTEVVKLFDAFQEAAREVAVGLRTKVLGLTVKELVQLQASVFGAASKKLGHEPTAKDINELFKVLPPRWSAMVERHHAERYFSGYNAVKGLVAGSGTGDGTGALPEGKTGTGGGTGGAPLAIKGTGTGSGEPPEGGSSGVGTGDGTAPVSEEDAKNGTGTGTGY